jgi:hypothetical protein
MTGLASPVADAGAPASSPATEGPAAAAPPGGSPGHPGPAPRPGAGRHALRAAASGRLARLGTTPGRIRLLAAGSVAGAALLAAVIAVSFGGVAGGVSAIGGTDAPEVTASAGLYFSLNDMDAQVANVLLATAAPALAADRAQYLATYDSDRASAYSDLQQAAVTAAGNAAAEQRLHQVLDDTGQYEALAADALLASQRHPAASAASGASASAAVSYYRQATDLMRTAILPLVSSLTSVSDAKLDASYTAGRSDAGTGTALTIAAGLVAIAGLLAFQLFLARRFRRLASPALAAATLIAVALTGTAAARLGAESGHLQVAKQDAFGSIVALSQARAVSYEANADESRYLADPGRAAMYQQSFLRESQQLASVGTVPLAGYEPALAADFSAWQAGHADVRFGGYLGAEFRNITFPGEQAAAAATLRAYLAYERDDHVLRTLDQASPQAAATFDTSMAPGQSNWAFYQYDDALKSLIAINQRAFTAAIAAGQGGAAGWTGLIPAGAALAIAALVLLGARPRLAEYR